MIEKEKKSLKFSVATFVCSLFLSYFFIYAAGENIKPLKYGHAFFLSASRDFRFCTEDSIVSSVLQKPGGLRSDLILIFHSFGALAGQYKPSNNVSQQ